MQVYTDGAKGPTSINISAMFDLPTLLLPLLMLQLAFKTTVGLIGLPPAIAKLEVPMPQGHESDGKTQYGSEHVRGPYIWREL